MMPRTITTTDIRCFRFAHLVLVYALDSVAGRGVEGINIVADNDIGGQYRGLSCTSLKGGV